MPDQPMLTPGYMSFRPEPSKKNDGYTESMARARRGFAERVGVDVNMGGRPRDKDRTFLSSDQLVKAVALRFTPEVARWIARRKIERPSLARMNGASGLYHFGDRTSYTGDDRRISIHDERIPSRVQVGREGDPLWGTSGAVAVAEHELLHAISFEHPAYRDDARAGFPRLVRAIHASRYGLSPQTYSDLLFLVRDDQAHAFTHAATLRSLPLPLRDYFAPVLR